MLFSAARYLGYATISEEAPIGWIRTPLLYAAHVAAMLTVSQVVDARTPARISTLAGLDITLYIGGWLYQKLSGDDRGEQRVPLSNASVG